MIPTLTVARDLIREALARRWFLALGFAITALLGVIAAGLSMEVVDGALSATRLFGDVVDTDIVAADVALRPVFRASAYVIFYGGLAFGILACADFGPELLSPGRIEHLLSLPIGRAALLLGTYCGVLCVIASAALYGAAGMTAILGLKTGVWTPRLLVTAPLGALTFAAIYGVMLSGAVFVRSAALTTLAGGLLFISGIFAGYRAEVALVFEGGLGRAVFEVWSAFIPPVSAIADGAAAISASSPVDLPELSRRVAGTVVFGAAALAVGLWRFERKDF